MTREFKIQHVGEVAYVMPRSEPDAFFVRRVGAFGIGLTFRPTSFGIGIDILKAGVLIAFGPLFLWVAHIEKQLGEASQ